MHEGGIKTLKRFEIHYGAWIIGNTFVANRKIKNCELCELLPWSNSEELFVGVTLKLSHYSSWSIPFHTTRKKFFFLKSFIPLVAMGALVQLQSLTDYVKDSEFVRTLLVSDVDLNHPPFYVLQPYLSLCLSTTRAFSASLINHPFYLLEKMVFSGKSAL